MKIFGERCLTLGTIIDILDEFQTPSITVVLERNRAGEWDRRYVVKVKRLFKTEEDARAAFWQAIPQKSRERLFKREGRE